MDTTNFAIKLIEAYKAEHNRMMRSRLKQYKIKGDRGWTSAMESRGLSTTVYRKDNMRSYVHKRFRNYFNTGRHSPCFSYFVSHSVKNAWIRRQELHIAQLRTRYDEEDHQIVAVKAIIASAKTAEVLTHLGKTWRKLVDAVFEEHEAYKARWEARCAIYAFNKMDLGIQIKFGSCNNGGGSMSYINHVIIDGDKIPLRKFLENVEFESVILSAPTERTIPHTQGEQKCTSKRRLSSQPE